MVELVDLSSRYSTGLGILNPWWDLPTPSPCSRWQSGEPIANDQVRGWGWLDWWVCINCQLAHTFVAKIGLGIFLEASSICGGSFKGTWCGSDGMPWFLIEISFRHPLIRIVHDMQFHKSKPLLLSQGTLVGPDCKNLQEAATTILKTRSQSWMHLADFFRYAGFLFTAFWHHIIFMLSVMFSFFFFLFHSILLVRG